MARRFRLFGKKRGDRQTGSRAGGSLLLALFFAAFFFGGWALLVAMAQQVLIPQWRANRAFVETTCVVRAVRIDERVSEGGSLYRPEVVVEYQAGGRRHAVRTFSIAHFHDGDYTADREENLRQLRLFPVGQKHLCWYDPDRPERAVVVRGFTWGAAAAVLLPVSFIVLGGGGLGYRVLNWATSAERRAAMAQQAEHAVQFDRFDQPTDGAEFPYVPSEGPLRDSPGTRLKYRLPMAVSSGWALFWLTAGCASWNGMLVAFLVVAICGFVAGSPDWFLALFLLPSSVAGVLLLRTTARRLRTAGDAGPTVLEISDHPLLPDREYELYLTQSARRPVRSLEVLLFCQEKVTYQQGTDTRADARAVFQQSIARGQPGGDGRGPSCEIAARFRVPREAMHSFRGKHNQVCWKLVVRGRTARGQSYQREFPVVVYPPPRELAMRGAGQMVSG